MAASLSPTEELSIKEEVVEVCGWETDMISIDPNTVNGDDVHTWIIFIPGNPGCIGWYKRLLNEVIQGLGKGYAGRGVSYAGHGVGIDKTTSTKDVSSKIAWTIEGQVHHKITWLTELVQLETNKKRLIFLTHSIGAHLVHRMCLVCPTICQMTQQIVHLMPFIRFDPPFFMKQYLTTVSQSPSLAIAFLRTMTKIASIIPRSMLDQFLSKSVPEGRDLAMDLLVQPEMATNFLQLGLQEIRDLPQSQPDIHAFQYLHYHNISIHMLYCGGPDHWAPPFHISDILQKKCSNVYITYMDQLLHGFVVFPHMIPPVVNFTVQSIQKQTSDNNPSQQRNQTLLTSKL